MKDFPEPIIRQAEEFMSYKYSFLPSWVKDKLEIC